MTDINKVSPVLTFSDKKKLIGWSDITAPEPDQIFDTSLQKAPEEEVTSSTIDRLSTTKSLAEKIIGEISKLEQKIDSRCARFRVSSQDGKGSTLYQAMFRIFGEKTTEISYDHYKRALEYRDQLAKEDAERIKLQ